MLREAAYFKFNDYSIPKDDPIHNAPTSAQLYNAIKKQMAPANVVLIMAGVYSTHSDWINKEIKIARDEFTTPKKIIAIEPWASKKTSQYVKDNADEVVGWNSQSIVSTIKKLT